jgi:hypothetical protein
MFCTECGTRLADGAAFCHSCGSRAPEPSVDASSEMDAEAAIATRPDPPPGDPGAAAEKRHALLSSGSASAREEKHYVRPTQQRSAVVGVCSICGKDLGEREIAKGWEVHRACIHRACSICGRALERQEVTEGWEVHKACLDREAGFGSRVESKSAARAAIPQAAPSPARVPGWAAAALVVLAALVIAIGIGGRAAAPAMAGTDCWELGGDEGIAIRVICAGDTDLGGWCAGLQSSSSNELNPAAAACALPALALQKAPLGVVTAVSLVIAGVLMLPLVLSLVLSPVVSAGESEGGRRVQR